MRDGEMMAFKIALFFLLIACINFSQERSYLIILVENALSTSYTHVLLPQWEYFSWKCSCLNGDHCSFLKKNFIACVSHTTYYFLLTPIGHWSKKSFWIKEWQFLIRHWISFLRMPYGRSNIIGRHHPLFYVLNTLIEQ